MRTIHTETVIDATPEAVWAVLTDLDSYPEWNPHVVRASGDLRVDGRLDITVDRVADRPREMTVRVTGLVPARRLAWEGTLFTPLLFRGRHTFELEPLADGRTRLVNREEVSGLLAGVVVSDIPEVDYQAMNDALAARVAGEAAGITGDGPTDGTPVDPAA